jgi:2'-5' RNA ligase
MLPSEDQPPIAKAPRIFVGLKVAPEIAEELAQLSRCLERFPTRFVASEDIHLTLLPPWNEASIPDAIEKLRAALSGLEGFTLTFTRLRYWPNRHQPRLLCAECMPTDEIKALQQALLNAFGQTEDKPFQPHVTLARMQRGARAAGGKSEMDRELSLVQSINSVELFQSHTQAGKGYQILASLTLAAPRRKWSDLFKQGVIRIAQLWGSLTHPETGKAAPGKDRPQCGIVSRSGASRCCNS